jgi:arginyl-tRNA synthetase
MVVNTQQTLIKKIKNIIEKTILSTPVFLASANINISDLSIEIEKNRDLQFGDFNTNFLMKTGLKFDQIAFFAEILINKIKKKRLFTKIKFAKPGYINFSINNNVLAKYLENAIRAKQKYGKFKPKKLFYNIEYVSANPTGLLHVGHARNAAFGSALVNV